MNSTVKPLIGCTLCMMLLTSCGDEKSGEGSSSETNTGETVTTSADPTSPVKAPEETSEETPEKSTTAAEDATAPGASTEPTTPPAEEEAPAEEEKAPAPENPPGAQAKPSTPQPSDNTDPAPLTSEALEVVTRARGGEAPAQSRLGVMYENGQGGLAKDWAKAAEWHLKAAEQGYPQSQYNLAMMYESGMGVAKDAAEAAKWFKAYEDNPSK
ncbi:MAG: tetratricopeptide repeat protein [Verrucomicrobiota bacterium]|nr:tetratricopeptide repeat protein [Verrucomicrobiota bacterium]